MYRTRIKMCGITSTDDALEAIAAGADALGFVFYPPSPRAVAVQSAAAIMRELPPFVAKVGLFVNATGDEIHAVLAEVPLDILQLHGDEPPALCDALSRPYIKSIRMRPDTQIPQLCQAYKDASALLIDTYVEGVAGGTGRTFDWSLIPKCLAKPIILAGGLTPDNVGAAIEQVRPYAVDVSGGIERGKGVKDPLKMRAFVQSVDCAKCG